MRVIVIAAIVIATSSRGAAAQDVVIGNLFAGAGAFACCAGETGAWEIGGGAEVPLRHRISAEVEIGLNGPLSEGLIKAPPSSYSFGTTFLASVGALYRFNPGSSVRRLRPFVAGGFGEAFRGDGAVGGVNVGGGVDWWVGERRGIRIEVRDQLLAEFGTTHLLVARFGLIFR